MPTLVRNCTHLVLLLLAAFLQVGWAGAKDGIEFSRSPAHLSLQADSPTRIVLGVVALDRLVAPTVNGHRLAGELPTGSVLTVGVDGNGSFSYSDRYTRRFRGRRPTFMGPDGRPGVRLESSGSGERFEDLTANVAGPSPQVLLDLDQGRSSLNGMAFPDFEDLLLFNGELVYRFDLGRPLTEFRLAGPHGKHRTEVSAHDDSHRILASNDGTRWTEIWRSRGQGERTFVDVRLPTRLLNGRPIYLKFASDQDQMLFDLHVSARFTAPTLGPLVRLRPGVNEYTYRDGASSSHRGSLFFEGPAVRAAPATPASYPAKGARVTESDDAITIRFASKLAVTLQRTKGRGIRAIGELTVGARRLLSIRPGTTVSGPTLELLAKNPARRVADWKAYVRDRDREHPDPEQWTFPVRGERTTQLLELDTAEYLGHALEGESVVLRFRTSPGDQRFEWVFTPASRTIQGVVYRGLGWKLRLEGLASAVWLEMPEAAVMRFGDWSFAQTWGHFFEDKLDCASPLAVPRLWYNGDMQPLFFAGGGEGSVLSFYGAPVCAEVATVAEAGRFWLSNRIPLGTGGKRETPTKYWLWSDRPLRSKWDALNAWTWALDSLSAEYRKAWGLGRTKLLPMLEMRFPERETAYMQRFLRGRSTPLEESWLVEFTTEKLDKMAALGFKVLRLVAWETDAEQHESAFLPGSACAGSGNAPWQLEVSPALGSVRALRKLTDAAHACGVQILLWTSPGHLSNSSPLLVQHPDWLSWRRNGTPENAGYGDVTGVSLWSGYNDYALDRYRAIHKSTNFDGFMVDSHLTFGIFPDYNQPQPEPQLKKTLATYRAWSRMGSRYLMLEGCAPFGISSGGFPGADTWQPGIPAEMRAEADRRLGWLKGKEYGLYRYVAETKVYSAEAYYRALAAGGQITPAHLDDYAELPSETRRRIRHTNALYNRLSDKMQRRRLIGTGDTWRGVAWSRKGSTEVVLFALETFDCPVRKPTVVHDLTADRRLEVTDNLPAEAGHVYVIGDGTGEGG